MTKRGLFQKYNVLQQVNKLWYIHKLEYYSAIKKETIFNKVKLEIPHNPVILLLGIYLKQKH